MLHAVTRVLGIGVLAVMLSGAFVGAAPAQAADKDLGWLRLQPAVGKTDAAVLTLTEGACPGGEAVVATLSGPNITLDGSVGNLVGVTQLKALDPTLSGQLWVPLSFAFRQWFAVNGVTMVPAKPYTITVVCRDLLRGSKTFGTYSGQVVFDAQGGYRALAEAAKPFNTELKPDDPTGVVIPTPGASGSVSAPAGTPTATPKETAAATEDPTTSPSAADDPSASQSAAPGPAPTQTAAPAPSASSDSGETDVADGPATTSGSSPTGFLLAGLLVLAVVGAVWALVSRRRTAPEADATTTPRHTADLS